MGNIIIDKLLISRVQCKSQVFYQKVITLINRIYNNRYFKFKYYLFYLLVEIVNKHLGKK